MAEPFVLARPSEVYENLRRCFVEAVQKPTMAELAKQFDMPVGTVYRRAADEQWNELRSARLQKAEADSEAKSLILQAVSRVDAQVMRAFADVAIIGLQKLSLALSRIPEEQASSTQAQTINTASFAFKNFCEGCKAVGIVSFEKNLEKLGKEDNGKWNPQLYQNINVNLGELINKAQAEVKAAEATTEPVKSANVGPDALPTT